MLSSRILHKRVESATSSEFSEYSIAENSLSDASNKNSELHVGQFSIVPLIKSDVILQSLYARRSSNDHYRSRKKQNIQLLLISKFSFTFAKSILILLIIAISHLNSNLIAAAETTSKQVTLSDENFTFYQNGSFIQLDAGRDWPFNSKREISFRFKTKSPHGLLIYQTFDHNKLAREEDQENLDLIPVNTSPSLQSKMLVDGKQSTMRHQMTIIPEDYSTLNSQRFTRSSSNDVLNLKQLSRTHRDNMIAENDRLPDLPSSITATASERLVNSLFSASPAAAINGNNAARAQLLTRISSREAIVSNGANTVSSRDPNSPTRNHRLLNSMAMNSESSGVRANYGGRGGIESGIGSTVLSSSAISSFSASLYELYLKLENGRLKIMYEFGSRLNQTYCGKGLNDDKWHKVDLKVDPELNQMILVLDQIITVEIVLSQQQIEDESLRRNELVFTNSVLYLGGLDNTAPLVKNLKQRLHTAQFIGCIGQIMLKTDQQSDSVLQPAQIENMVFVKRGCLNKCDTDNYCLHKSSCINYYSHTKCDCFGTNYEDIYCWQDDLTTLSMLGYSTLVYRIYDWRDRHHSSINRLSMQFKTLALDSVLFFAYGDFSAQQNLRNYINNYPLTTMMQAQSPFTATQMNISNLMAIHRPASHQVTANSNYLAVSLSNGTIVVEVNFGDQPILLSDILYDKVYNKSGHSDSADMSPTSDNYRPLSLSDGRWHNITLLHNNKQLSLHVDNYSFNYTILSKNYYLYFDPSIYVGAVPNLLLNETRMLAKPFNLRHKFVGCLRSVYFNQHNLLLALKQNSSNAEYRDMLGKPRLDTCLVQEPNFLPLTLRSGKSYLTFQLSPSNQQAMISNNLRFEPTPTLHKNSSSVAIDSKQTNSSAPLKKLTRIEFEYKTSLGSYFLAGGHLRDLSYHDLGGFWTLHAREECQLVFTVSSGLTFEPEQVIQVEPRNTTCDYNSWYKISVSILSGDRILNISRSRVATVHKFEDEYYCHPSQEVEYSIYILKSSIELLHQVQLGGDLAKFGESLSIPFSGCIRKIKINNHLFDSRDFVTSAASMLSLTNSVYNSTFMPSRQTQSDVIASRISQGYVTLDSCQLVIPCATMNPCKNNGICKINELGEPDCDCSKTGYTGKRCQFSIHKQSCQDLYLSGQRRSSYYLIDLDRNGPLKPIRVRCNMEEVNNQIETVLSHNLPPEYLVRRSDSKDIQIDITYLAFHHMLTADGFYLHNEEDESVRKNQDMMLRSLIGQSLYCRQYFRYECRSAPLELGNRTWMEVAYPKSHRLTSLDGANHGKCVCATTEKKCLDPTKNCNCDSNESIWTDDSYDLLGHEDVGITRIVLMKQSSNNRNIVSSQYTTSSESQSRFTLSDLKCYGAKQQENQHVITFKTSDAYIELPGWRRGDISFSFRTASNPPAIVLYQLATSRNHGYFRLTLISDLRLQFEFIVNRRPRKLLLSSTHKLNNGEWQQVFIEYDSVNLRLTVNDDSVMVDLDTNDYLGTFEGPLFIGGAPRKYLAGDLSKRNGFTGCFRGLNIDNRFVDLKSYLNPSMPTVTSGCKPSCTKNLCQNGGRCIEYWGSYECECSNPIAHSGSNCEINLNTNSITFVTQESYYVQLSNESLLYPSYLIKNILLNVRTYQETALILYASDHLNNFVQLHKNGTSLVLTYNSNSTIVLAQVPIEDVLNYNTPVSNTNSLTYTNIENVVSNSTNHATVSNVTSLPSSKPSTTVSNITSQSMENHIRASNTSGSGQPIQVKIERHRLRTTFYVNSNFVIVEKPIMFLTNYTQNPWVNPELELVRPPRPKMGSKTYSQIFLANIDEYFTTRLPGFTGCIQGLSIDNQLFDFNRAHLTGELKGEYRIGCKMRCDSFPCKNQGTCIENWKEDRIQCKCDTTSYVGRLCDEDVAAVFNGYSSHFIYNLSKKFTNWITISKPVLDTQSNSSSSLASSTTRGQNQSAPTNALPGPKPIDIREMINFFEISLAFSTDSNQYSDKHKTHMQVLVYITRANSSRHFFLGLTPDGSLLIQEDYGNSMSLSRLIKRIDHPYNDGHRHIVKYSRFNQTIHINVDYQTYLPTMGVLTANQISRYSKTSQILVGTTSGQVDFQQNDESRLDGNYTNYNGCISNLVIKIEDLTIEPLSEAFGQDLETINVNVTKKSGDKIEFSTKVSDDTEKKVSISEQLVLAQSTKQSEESTLKINPEATHSKMLSIINRSNGQEVIDETGTIIAHDVEQGKCAPFKKSETLNEKRSINEPKNTPLLELRPVYMDPPRLKPSKNALVETNDKETIHGFGLFFYFSVSILAIVASSTLIYAYVLHARYKSEKFRCETPFFHKRNNNMIDTGN